MARIAILDANVLWPQYLRDILIRAAISDVYRAARTDRILEEMRRSLIRRERVSPDQIDRTVRFMRDNCAHFMVEGYENLIPVMTNDEKDWHVLAAAEHTGADTIVTSNTKHFPFRTLRLAAFPHLRRIQLFCCQIVVKAVPLTSVGTTSTARRVLLSVFPARFLE